MCHYYGSSTRSEDDKAQAQRAQDAARQRRAGVIDKLLGAAKDRVGESKPAEAPAKEPASAK